ncbi:MAG: DsrE family protein [Promethearchaeota archaeon]
MTEQKEKILLVGTQGPEAAERCYAPFVVGTTAQVSDVEANVFLMMDGVVLAMEGAAKKVSAPGFPPLEELMTDFVEEGGKIYVCSNSQEFRKINPKKLVKGSEIAGAAALVDLILDHDRTVWV